jgi:outer membrane receptor protein involved in Fe transport
MMITLRAGWLDSEFLDFKNEIFVRDPLGGGRLARTTDFSGNPLPNAPEYQVSGGINWPIEIGRFGTLIPRWDFTWKSDTFFDPTEGRGVALIDGTLLPDNTIGQPAFILHNIRLSWRSPDTNIEVSGWCRNVADQRYKNFAFDVSIFRGVVINYVGDPRSCGGSVSYTW